MIFGEERELNDKNGTEKKYNWQDTLWVLTIGGEAGLLIAVPVLLGLGLGYLLDKSFGTLPWITLLLTTAGMIGGPILVYRWVRTTVKDRLDKQAKEE